MKKLLTLPLVLGLALATLDTSAQQYSFDKKNPLWLTSIFLWKHGVLVVVIFLWEPAGWTGQSGKIIIDFSSGYIYNRKLWFIKPQQSYHHFIQLLSLHVSLFASLYKLCISTKILLDDRDDLHMDAQGHSIYFTGIEEILMTRYIKWMTWYGNELRAYDYDVYGRRSSFLGYLYFLVYS